jgi:N-methylhydantoinase A
VSTSEETTVQYPITFGVDVGGTFTDFILVDETGQVHCFKVPSTPKRPADSTINGVAEIKAALQFTDEQLQRMQHTHSSTIATNAVIERRGPVVGALVTTGLRDIFELQRLAVPDPLRYDSQRPVPLIPRGLVAEVSERMNVAGETVDPLDEEQLIAAAQDLIARGATSLVLCFLHSYVNPEHEIAARDALAKALPDIPVEISSSIWPQAREYERATLTAINASIRPVMQEYLDSIAAGMREHGLANEPTIARSNGGMQRAHTIRDWPVAALLSGPACGVAGAARVAADAGLVDADLVTVDVGGTSADIGVVRHGQPLLSGDENIAGMPVLVPSIAVSAIGAGGGSIIWVDQLGNLKVGPRSLGADPGPAAYGQQSEIAGLSDAFLLAGWLSTEQQLAGRLALSLGNAQAAMGKVGDAFGATPRETADGAIRIAIAMMAAETSKVLARRGVDAPTFTLVAYGGAGPLVGALLAEEVYVDSVLIPPRPGALSAFGAARSDLEGDLVSPIYKIASTVQEGQLAKACTEILSKAADWLAGEQATLPVIATAVQLSIEMRYVGQGYDVNVPVQREWLESGDLAAIGNAFHAEHRALFGHDSPENDIWLRELRAHVVGTIAQPATSFIVADSGTAEQAVTGQRDVLLRGTDHTATVYDRSKLAPGSTFSGPAIVEQMDTTTLVPDGWSVRVAGSGSLLMSRTGARSAAPKTVAAQEEIADGDA